MSNVKRRCKNIKCKTDMFVYKGADYVVFVMQYFSTASSGREYV